MLDLLLKGGKIVDGTGNPWYYGDVAIKDKYIVAVGNITAQAAEIINVNNKIVAPGFIDIHTHGDLAIFDQPLGEIKLQQGVTTEVFGNCGLAPAPVIDETKELLDDYIEPIIGRKAGDWKWNSVGEYIEKLSKLNISHNVATFMGSGALRIAVNGFARGQLSPAKRNKIEDIMADGMKAGAMGMSLGLMYMPDCFYAKEELANICRTLVKYRGILTTHIRGECKSLLSSIKEVIYIAENAGLPLNISHFKACGKNNWGKKIEDAMSLVEDARSRGVDVTCDVYPYCAGSTSLISVLPPWTQEGGVAKCLERIRDMNIRKEIHNDLEEEHEDWDNPAYEIGWDKIYIASVKTDGNKVVMGKNIKEIAAQRMQDEIDCVMDLLLEEDAQITRLNFHISEDDVKKVIAWDRSLIISDSIYSVRGNIHPRVYGAFPRLFSRYVREEKILSLEQAVRKVTSYPAQRLGLSKRGLIIPGYIGDIVVFDAQKIKDKATYANPREYPEGIDLVIVGGKKTIESGIFLGVDNGEVLKHKMF